MKKFGGFLALFLVATLVAIVLWPTHEKAPSFQIKDLSSTNSLSSDVFQNKVTLLNFWYPSCPGCVSEMPKLIQTAKDYQQNQSFQIIAIAMPFDDEATVLRYMAEKQIPFKVAYDTAGEAGKSYIVQVAPMSFLIDQQGRIIKKYIGEPDFTQLHHEIDILLAAK